MTPSDWQSVLSKQKKPAIVGQIEQEEAAEILLFQLATKKGQQGSSTAVGVPDLRSKQGEFQPKTAQSLRHSTACSASSHHTRWVSEPYTCWGTRPPACHAFLPSQWAPLDRQSAAQPGPPSLPLTRPGNGAARTVFLMFKPLVGKSVYNSLTAVEFLVDKQLALGHLVPSTSP